ncbi:hypothetical protein CLU79DRAFT_754297 [Phycomyces nitens]|nr:hypothetical protein CLU79DRAFT_754297 [Phycomyces nitens]
MKIHTIVLGEYGTPSTQFCLYQFRTPLTPPLTSPPTSSVRHSMDKYSNNIDFFCIRDLTSLFFHSVSHLNDLFFQLYREHSSYFCKDSTGKSYLMTSAVADLATRLHMPLLADLCRLDQQHWSAETTQTLLKSIPGLHPQSPVVVEKMFAPMRLDGHESLFVSRGKLMDLQSPVIRLSPPSDPSKPHELPFSPAERVEKSGDL